MAQFLLHLGMFHQSARLIPESSLASKHGCMNRVAKRPSDYPDLSNSFVFIFIGGFEYV